MHSRHTNQQLTIHETFGPRCLCSAVQEHKTAFAQRHCASFALVTARAATCWYKCKVLYASRGELPKLNFSISCKFRCLSFQAVLLFAEDSTTNHYLRCNRSLFKELLGLGKPRPPTLSSGKFCRHGRPRKASPHLRIRAFASAVKSSLARLSIERDGGSPATSDSIKTSCM